MSLKKVVRELIRGLILIALVFLFLAWIFPNPWLFSTELVNVDKEKDTICQDLKVKMTKQKPIRFLVSSSIISYLFGAHTISVDIIYFSPAIIKESNFEVIAAHELGHIEYDTSNQVKADFFAMKVLGKERVLKHRRDSGLPQEFLDMITLCFDSHGNNCPYIDTFSDYKTPGKAEDFPRQ